MVDGPNGFVTYSAQCWERREKDEPSDDGRTKSQIFETTPALPTTGASFWTPINRTDQNHSPTDRPTNRPTNRPTDPKRSEAKRSEAKQSKAKQSKAKQSGAKRSKAKQSKAKQSKAKQSKAKQTRGMKFSDPKELDVWNGKILLVLVGPRTSVLRGTVQTIVSCRDFVCATSPRFGVVLTRIASGG
jgi:FtsZ-interacting cell division protein ZipA